INLRKPKHFRIGQFSSDALRKLVEIINFFVAQSQTFLFIISRDVVDFKNRLRLDADGKNVLIQLAVSLGKHRIEWQVTFWILDKFLNSDNALDSHVLGDFDSVRAPGRNHSGAWPNKKIRQDGFLYFMGVSEQPVQLGDGFGRKSFGRLNGIYRVL